MADVFSKRKRSQIMSMVRSRENVLTEQVLVHLFRSNRISGWRRHQCSVFGNPDFIFRKARLAVFVDGCFWHGCPLHGTLPSSNTDFWARKLARNQARDCLVNTTLRRQGWRVVRLWQHQIKKDPTGCINKIVRVIEAGK